MKYLLFSFLGITFCLLATSCQDGLDEELMLGKWQAVELREQGELVDMDLSPVYFDFSNSQRYYFQSTLNLHEAGRYYTLGQLLYTTDTTSNQPLEKAVKVIQLNKDSMAFLMNDNGLEKRLQLVRKTQ